MKKQLTTIILSALCAGSVFYFSSFVTKETRHSNKEKPEYIVLDVYEVPSYDKKGIHVHYGEGKTEVIPFKEFKTENHDDNGELLVTVLNRLHDEDGYEVVGTSTGKAQSGMITKIIMKKH